MANEDVGRVTAARWRTVRRVVGAFVIVAIGVGILVAPGVDEQEVRADDASIWALQSSTGQRFGRVNTQLREVDTVKSVSEPSDLTQYEDSLLVYSHNLSSVTKLQTARPADIDEASSDSTVATPAGTDSVTFAGDVVGYLTDDYRVLVGRVSDGSALAPSVVDPYAADEVEDGQDRRQYRSDAMTVGANGDVAAFSAEDGNVMRGKVDGATYDGFDAVPGAPSGDQVQMTMVGDQWVLLDTSTGQLWRRGGDAPIITEVATEAILQRPSGAADAVYIADEYGIVSVPLDGSGAERVYGSTDLALGEPAAPTENDDVMVGAWLPAGPGPGRLWDSDGKATDLDYGDSDNGGGALGENRSLVLRSNGSRLIVNETRTGWVWDVPSGLLVRSSQQWAPDEKTTVEADDQETAEQVSEPRAPVAEDDAIGVRAGRQVIVPALLNDHDANDDILTLVPGDLTPLDSAFGTVTVSDDDQSLVVNVAPDATGSATFNYVITDGTASDGLRSEPATVTLSVKGLDENNPPVWCGVEDCLSDWPTPQVSPGGTVSTDALAGWVDPEGDPIYIESATTASTTGVVAASPEGRVVFQHSNASSTETGAIPVEIVVSDSRGATASKTMNVTVLGEPALVTKDVAATITAGVRATVEVSDHVTGAQGPLQVNEASLGPDARANVSLTQGLIGFTFDSDTPGSYVVDYVVSDGLSDARGKARITVIAPEDEQLTTVPLTAFVRAKEDVTVDVLSAISNPGGHVLLLSDVTTEPELGATLSADVVGHSALRLAGSTSDAQPGALGVVSYTASDGTGRPEATVHGEITVVLLDSDVPSAPLAVDDSITVRVGTQADISVLKNDVGPAGNVIALDPGSVTADDGAGLAFPAGPRIRYLAPSVPGNYVISYSTYVLGYPAQRDTASVVVTVLANDTNAPPTPRGVTGRVASGESVRLPFDGTGIDPDGDKVTLSGIATQPEHGNATVSADGTALIYTSVSGYSGQDLFTFNVVDQRGLSASATALIGVLADDLDPSPVTYTDYVQVQVGSDRRVVVTPTANDVDLAGGELELIDVKPDATLGTEEYKELSDHLVGVEDGDVALQVGEDPGTFSFFYTVRNTSGSTAVGRIILKAVREPITDVPIVTDTVLTQENRETFAEGVDVLTNKVSWGSGDPSGLVLTLWGAPEDLVVSGTTISGPLPEQSRLIPFQVDGQNFAGEEVTSYGFLTVPAADAVRLSLKEVPPETEVNEDESVDFDVANFVVLPPDSTLEVDASSIAPSGVRGEATCSLVSGTTLRYSAGMGAPYSDTCVVSLRIAGQEDWTVLPVTITIVAEEPQPTLTGAALEVSPGDTANFDLGKMVTWPAGATARPVTFSTSYNGEQFEFTAKGDDVTVVANDKAVPGASETVTVALTTDPDIPAVSLALKVGPAPSELPKGGSAVKQCSQSEGSSCTVTVIGAKGEVNPLPGTPLQIVDVNGASECSSVSFTVASATAVKATWTADTPGAVCNAVFSVRDAQGRVSGPDRQGTISIDLLGYPVAPVEVKQVAFGDGTATLAVSPNGSGSSYPSVSGFALYRGTTKVATCDAKGACPQLTGLKNGDKQTYTAKSVNSVGESKAAVTAQAWSYAPPAAPTNASWVPTVATPNNAGKQVDITLSVKDSSTKELKVSSPNGETRVVPVNGVGKVNIPQINVGSNEAQQVTIVPVTALDLPPVKGGEAQGASISVTANGVGGPKISNPDWDSNDAGNKATFTVAVGSAGAGSTTWVGAGAAGACKPTVQSKGGAGAVTLDVTPNEQPKNYTICAESRYNSDTYGTATESVEGVYTYVAPANAPTPRNGYSFGTSCGRGGYSCENTLDRYPKYDPAERNFTVRYGTGPKNAGDAPKPLLKEIPNINAYNCISFAGAEQQCADNGVKVTVDSPTKYLMSAQFTSCWANRDGHKAQYTIDANSNDYTVTEDWYVSKNGNQKSIDGMPWTFNFAQITVEFKGNLQGMNTWTSDRRGCENTATEQVEVPNVVGMGQAAAEQTLRDAGLNPSVTQIVTTVEGENGLVLSQNKAPGAQVDKDSTVVIEVGSYTAPDPPPDPPADPAAP
ncbi:Ig-like domain-containing protein [Demequina oxidasica]|uniref:Ig-like domain-containing protein n=1 Tax=Demequina oxidasica TaxID=676199 RepID=UPI00078150BB|nr:Ig-like domain-containing protein [Demequina oxidasica]